MEHKLDKVFDRAVDLLEYWDYHRKEHEQESGHMTVWIDDLREAIYNVNKELPYIGMLD